VTRILERDWPSSFLDATPYCVHTNLMEMARVIAEPLKPRVIEGLEQALGLAHERILG
jgi:hypothetical protein